MEVTANQFREILSLLHSEKQVAAALKWPPGAWGEATTSLEKNELQPYRNDTLLKKRTNRSTNSLVDWFGKCPYGNEAKGRDFTDKELKFAVTGVGRFPVRITVGYIIAIKHDCTVYSVQQLVATKFFCRHKKFDSVVESFPLSSSPPSQHTVNLPVPDFSRLQLQQACSSVPAFLHRLGYKPGQMPHPTIPVCFVSTVSQSVSRTNRVK